MCQELDLNKVIDRNVKNLSGGELQRFAIAATAVQNADIFMFDEPSSYLDVKQRLKAAQIIRSLLRHNRFVLYSCMHRCLHPKHPYVLRIFPLILCLALTRLLL